MIQGLTEGEFSLKGHLGRVNGERILKVIAAPLNTLSHGSCYAHCFTWMFSLSLLIRATLFSSKLQMRKLRLRKVN